MGQKLNLKGQKNPRDKKKQSVCFRNGCGSLLKRQLETLKEMGQAVENKSLMDSEKI